MLRFESIRSWALCLALGITGLPSTATAQVTDGALRVEQSALFEAMSGDPQNLDLMFRYAGVSARLEDYEAAISTLERMLIFNPDLPRVRLELGALYFNIGSYAVAERYFREVLERGDVPPPVRARVERFRAEIAERTRRHRFDGRIEVGIVHDSNAALGPTDRDVLLFGQRARRVGNALDESDTGAKVIAEVTHRYDFGGQGNEYWRTDAAFTARRYADVDEGSSESVFVRTGPQLALDDTYFGPKARPFVDAAHVRVDDERLYTEGGVGLEFFDILGDEWSTFGSVRAAFRNHGARNDEEDGAIFEVTGGAAWTPMRDLTLTGAAGIRVDRADADFESNTEASLRLAATYDYDPGLAVAEEKWRFSAYASAAWRSYDEPNPVVTANERREDVDLRFGVRHVFSFREGFYAALDANVLERQSSISNFELDNLGVGAAIGYKF